MTLTRATRQRRPVPRSRHLIAAGAQALITAGLLAALITHFGGGPFSDAIASVRPSALLGALALGAAGALLQGLRWRIVAAGLGDQMPRRSAVARCYEAAFLNAVLPGGLVGDAMRAVRRRVTHDATWGTSLWSVVGERLCGTVIALTAAAAGLTLVDTRLAALVGLAALVVTIIASRALRGLSARDTWGVWALSAAGWTAYLALFFLAARGVGADLPAGSLAGLGAITVGGMSIPVNLAGWGPREGAAAFAFDAYGAGGALGLATSVSYGLLALVSVLPGGALLLLGTVRGGRRREQQFGADVLPEYEAA